MPAVAFYQKFVIGTTNPACKIVSTKIFSHHGSDVSVLHQSNISSLACGIPNVQPFMFALCVTELFVTVNKASNNQLFSSHSPLKLQHSKSLIYQRLFSASKLIRYQPYTKKHLSMSLYLRLVKRDMQAWVTLK